MHEDGKIAGSSPSVSWMSLEHARLVDYKPTDCPKYIESFMANAGGEARGTRDGELSVPSGDRNWNTQPSPVLLTLLRVDVDPVLKCASAPGRVARSA